MFFTEVREQFTGATAQDLVHEQQGGGSSEPFIGLLTRLPARISPWTAVGIYKIDLCFGRVGEHLQQQVA